MFEYGRLRQRLTKTLEKGSKIVTSRTQSCSRLSLWLEYIPGEGAKQKRRQWSNKMIKISTEQHCNYPSIICRLITLDLGFMAPFKLWKLYVLVFIPKFAHFALFRIVQQVVVCSFGCRRHFEKKEKDFGRSKEKKAIKQLALLTKKQALQMSCQQSRITLTLRNLMVRLKGQSDNYEENKWAQRLF